MSFVYTILMFSLDLKRYVPKTHQFTLQMTNLFKNLM